MPTYDYECRACGHEFEQFQSMSAGALRKCPACGKLRLRRLIGSGAGIIFKGSGFYETDYKRRSMPKTAGTESKDSSDTSSDSSSSKKDASKPADKSKNSGKKD